MTTLAVPRAYFWHSAQGLLLEELRIYGMLGTELSWLLQGKHPTRGTIFCPCADFLTQSFSVSKYLRKRSLVYNLNLMTILYHIYYDIAKKLENI